MSDNDKGPALEESIEVDLKALDEALAEVPEPELPQPNVTITFTGKEFEAVSRCFSVELMLAFPNLFFAEGISEEGRMFFIEMAYQSGVHAVHKITPEEASALRKKFADATLAKLRNQGLNVDEFVKKQMETLSNMGFETKVTDGVNLAGEYHDGSKTDVQGPAEGDTPTQEAQRGSEPEPGQS